MALAPRLTDLPVIVWDLTAEAPDPRYRAPWRDGDSIFATDWRLLIRLDAVHFAPKVVRAIRRRTWLSKSRLPDGAKMFGRWKGSPKPVRLPAFDGTIKPGDDLVMVGPHMILAHRIAFLLRHGVRHIHPGRTSVSPARFDLGELGEGLLMPADRPKYPKHEIRDDDYDNDN